MTARSAYYVVEDSKSRTETENATREDKINRIESKFLQLKNESKSDADEQIDSFDELCYSLFDFKMPYIYNSVLVKWILGISKNPVDPKVIEYLFKQIPYLVPVDLVSLKCSLDSNDRTELCPLKKEILKTYWENNDVANMEMRSLALWISRWINEYYCKTYSDQSDLKSKYETLLESVTGFVSNAIKTQKLEELDSVILRATKLSRAFNEDFISFDPSQVAQLITDVFDESCYKTNKYILEWIITHSNVIDGKIIDHLMKSLPSLDAKEFSNLQTLLEDIKKPELVDLKKEIRTIFWARQEASILTLLELVKKLKKDDC